MILQPLNRVDIDNALRLSLCGTCVSIQSSGRFVVNSALKWDDHVAGISLKAAKRLWVLHKRAESPFVILVLLIQT